MININLLPNKYKYQLKFRRIHSYFNALLVLIIIILACTVGLLFIIKQLIISNTSNIDNQITKTKEEIAKLQDRQAKVEEFNNKISTISNIISKQPSWTLVLSDISKKAPQDLYIDNFSIDSSSTKEVSIKGTSTSIDSIMDFTKSLDASDNFSKPILSELSGSKTGETGLMTYNFNLKITVDAIKYNPLKSDKAKSSKSDTKETGEESD